MPEIFAIPVFGAIHDDDIDDSKTISFYDHQYLLNYI